MKVVTAEGRICTLRVIVPKDSRMLIVSNTACYILIPCALCLCFCWCSMQGRVAWESPHWWIPSSSPRWADGQAWALLTRGFLRLWRSSRSVMVSSEERYCRVSPALSLVRPQDRSTVSGLPWTFPPFRDWGERCEDETDCHWHPRLWRSYQQWKLVSAVFHTI